MADPETPRLTPHREAFRDLAKDERHANRAETQFWCHQFKLRASSLAGQLDDANIALDAERTRREQAERERCVCQICSDYYHDLKTAEAERDDLRRQVTAANGKWTALREYVADRIGPDHISMISRIDANNLLDWMKALDTKALPLPPVPVAPARTET